MSNNIVLHGLGDDLIVTGGLGDTQDISSDRIIDHVSRALSLFITQFRGLRVVNNDPIIIATFPRPEQTPVPEPEMSKKITNHVNRGRELFITQFRQVRGYNG